MSSPAPMTGLYIDHTKRLGDVRQTSVSHIGVIKYKLVVVKTKQKLVHQHIITIKNCNLMEHRWHSLYVMRMCINHADVIKHKLVSQS